MSLKYFLIAAREDTGKKNWIDTTTTTTTAGSDSISLDSPTNDSVSSGIPPKRRKFFKSRECNSVSSSSVPPPTSASVSNQLNAKITPPNLSHTIDDGDDNSQKCSQSVNSSTSKNIGNSQVKPQRQYSSGSVKSGSGGGIKLKIFKSRNSDVNSCETYSSTVQLPSDDSGSSSSSSSVANSPRPETAGQLEINQAQSPNGLVLDSCPSSGFVSDEVNSSKNLIPDSISNNSTSFNPSSIVNENYNSSLSYSTDLLSEVVDKKISDDSSICTENITESYSSINIKDNSVLGNESDLLDINESVSRVEESDRLRTKSISKNDTEEEVVVNKREQSPSSQDSQEVDLFSTDFDENEIIDRTSIEYPSNSSTFKFSDQSLSRSNTIDLDDVESSQSSSLTNFSSNSVTKSQSLRENDSKSSVLTKKRSIFKSRQKEDSKKRATYKHKWHGNEDKEESFKKGELPKSTSTVGQLNDDPFSFDATPVLKRVQTWPSNSQAINDSFEEEQQPIIQVKCPRQAKKVSIIFILFFILFYINIFYMTGLSFFHKIFVFAFVFQSWSCIDFFS